MTQGELVELLRNGEGSGLEFKLDDVAPQDLAREIVAFANFRGGRILLGVDDEGCPRGIRRGRLEEWVVQRYFPISKLSAWMAALWWR